MEKHFCLDAVSSNCMTGCVEKLNLTEIETQVVIKKRINLDCFSGPVYTHHWKASLPILGRGFFLKELTLPVKGGCESYFGDRTDVKTPVKVCPERKC